MGAGAAWAEDRTFVVSNAADGYGVDRCLATGAACGELIANAFCQSKDFARAASFRKLEAAEVTASTSAAGTAKDDLVAIQCRR